MSIQSGYRERDADPKQRKQKSFPASQFNLKGISCVIDVAVINRTLPARRTVYSSIHG